jgi:hypothetical protein
MRGAGLRWLCSLAGDGGAPRRFQVTFRQLPELLFYPETLRDTPESVPVPIRVDDHLVTLMEMLSK